MRTPLGILLVAATALGAALGAVPLAATPLAAGAGAASGPPDVRVVTLNLLHGAFCPRETASCRAAQRVELLGRLLEDAKCPQVVGLQEISADLDRLVRSARRRICDGRYRVVLGPSRSLDTELVLTTLPVRSTTVKKLVGGFRTASRVVLRSALGPLVVVVTHQDGDPETPVAGATGCRRCPPPCPVGSPVLACQTVVAADLASRAGGRRATRVLMGDFNVTPASQRYRDLLAAGWVDSYVAAGNPECDPASGTGCTSGRDDKSLESLTDPTSRETERIDFLFVRPAAGCRLAFDGPADPDADGLGTTLFAAQPTAAGPGGLAWPSDHTGVAADLSCAKERA